MDEIQAKLLRELAEKLKRQKRSKSQALDTLVAAGILTTKGNFTKHYPELRKAQKSLAEK